MNSKSIPVALACLALCSLPALAQGSGGGDEARSLLASASIFGSSPRIVARLEMRISGSGGDKTREIELSIAREGANTRSLARIINPAFLSDMKFLKRIESGQSDSQWVKTSRGVRRLGDGNRYEQIFGSDFTAEDFGAIGSTGFDIYRDFSRDGPDERVVAARPLLKAPYALRLIYINRSSGLVTRMEYLDGDSRVLRKYMVTKVEGEGLGARPLEAIMEDTSRGGSTSLKILSMTTPSAIPDRVFNPGNL
jgi:hypothetical protein